MVRKVVIGVVGVVVVIVLAVAGFMWWSTRAGTPNLPADLEALRSEAEGVGEARPHILASGWTVVVTSVETDSAMVRVWPDDDMDEFAVATLKVGTSEAVGSCTVALLETHPGRSGSEPGSQTGWALLHVSCPPRPTASPSETATSGPSAKPTATPGGATPSTTPTAQETQD